MPNVIDANGLELETYDETLSRLQAKMQEIYGTDINLGSDTPDGQMLTIFCQEVQDLKDLLQSIYSQFDPDQAIGKVLDQRVAINGIERQGGSYTITPITLVNSQSVNLYGLDQDTEDVYTISDNEGNLWQLMETQLGLAAGTHVLDFRAAVPGEQLTIPNTINVPVSIILGVTSVNNPTSYSNLGINEETDIQLKVRRQRSVSLASQGYLAGLLAALLDIPGMTSAFVYENRTGSTDGDGVPGHSIWVIVAGTAAAADIADVIYKKRNAGCGMYGIESYIITQADGTSFEVNWDEVINRNYFIRFTVTSIDGVVTPSVEAIREGVAAQFVPGVYEEININGLATLVQEIDPNALVTNAGFTLGETQVIGFSAVPDSGTFKLSYNGEDTGALNWNDSAATIQTAIQALTGLSNTTVSGTTATSLTFNLSGEDDVLGLITLKDNALLDGATPVTPSYDTSFANTLLPGSKQEQLLTNINNVIVIAMQLLPLTSEVATAGEVEFFAYGGYGDYTFSLSVNASGGSIDAGTGVYTAGGTPGTDTVLVTDALGNTATATVEVA